ncbi:copper chaperone [Skermanella aerolata]|uniref:Copper chaperone CopZ n=1 Tax=Skermanella aerolata TaxID=393310 RepID=A0A512DX65_9PROT|nr:heavy-metal-associated domain-containing protein [Skermanella aerolata]KJB93560.1 heavy metal transporter [Skermanella aerolata KACC 11604]GEO41062.1 copper chaperone CopZ [Skermanella aerolata]
MSAKYKVSGMTCGGCVRSVTNAITARDSAATVEVDLPTGVVTVDGDLSEDTVKDAVEGAGFDFGGRAAA